MKKYMLLKMLVLLLMASTSCAQKERQTYGIGFYNLENLFDTCHDAGKSDYEFLPDGTSKWTGLRYSHKLRNMSRVLSEMGTGLLPDEGCAIIGVAEVENNRCLKDLCAQPALKKRNYKFCHVEGPDHRGIDCALLYNPLLYKVRNVKLVPYVYDSPKDRGKSTRGFLTVSGTLAGEHLSVIVCHWPSRGTEAPYRVSAGRQVRAIKDSLLRDDPEVKVIVMGDMNDDPVDRSMTVGLGCRPEIKEVGPRNMYNPWYNVLVKQHTGTLKHKGRWNLFDQIVVTPNLLDRGRPKDRSTLKFVRHEVFRPSYLFQQKGRHKGSIHRTFAGGNWLDGYSDHLPTVIYLSKGQR